MQYVLLTLTPFLPPCQTRIFVFEKSRKSLKLRCIARIPHQSFSTLSAFSFVPRQGQDSKESYQVKPLSHMYKIILIANLIITYPTSAFISHPITTHKLHNNHQHSSTHMSSTTQQINDGDGKFHFAIDRGGTFTDVHCKLPNGTELVSKLLSVDPANYDDAPTEGIRRLLNEHDPTGKKYPRGEKVNTSLIGSIRMGTTVATNALLEREGERMGLVITKGFGDLLKIGDQTRSDM